MVSGSFLENKENGKHRALGGSGGGRPDGASQRKLELEKTPESLHNLALGCGPRFLPSTDPL